MVAPNNAWDRLYRAMRPLSEANMDGPWQLLISGSVNLAGGGGAGGTSMVDNNPFTPGGTSITPAGGYVGGRTIASGNAGAIALSPSGAVLVHVIAGGAGGGLAQLQVVGSDNSNFANVGWPSGGSPTFNSIPVQVMNAAAIGGGGGGFASVAVYGSPANPVYMVGSINPNGVFAPAGSVNVYGSVNISNAVGVFGSVTGVQTVNIASHIDTANSALRVNVIAGGAGGGLAQMQVIGTNNSTWANVGFASGNSATFNSVPVLVMNPAGAGAAYASVAVYGSPANPVYIVGSLNPVGVFGSVNVIGSIGATQLGAPWSFIGSAGVTPLAAFSLSGVPQVDPRGSLVPTQWIISVGGSGQFAIAGSAPASQRIYFTGYRFTAVGTVDMQFQSPSGVAISGSMRILPGAGMVDNGGGNWPVLQGSQQSPIFILFTGTQNVGGWANGYIAP